VNNDWTNVGVSLAANLLSLPSKYSEWKAKDKSVTMVKVQRLMLTAGIIAQVHLSLHDYKVKEEQFSLYDNSLGISDSLLGMTKERNKAGTKGYSDTVVTQNMLESLVTRLERDRALVDLLNSYNMMLVTLGLDHGRWREPLTADAGETLENSDAVPVSKQDDSGLSPEDMSDANAPAEKDGDVAQKENHVLERGYVSALSENPGPDNADIDNTDMMISSVPHISSLQ
jgi:hypothetical protein